MIILHWNIRSCRSNNLDLQCLIKKYQPHLICLNETWLQTNNIFKITYYNCIRDDRADGKGGIAIFVKKGIPFKQITTNTILNKNELQVIAIDLGVIRMVSMYIPPGVNITTQHLQDIKRQIEEPLILLGDLNAQHTCWGSGKTNTRGKNVLEFINEENMIYLNDGTPTRITRPDENISAPDIGICSADIGLQCTWRVEMDCGGSDHLPVLCEYAGAPIEETSIITTYKWKTRNANWKDYTNQLEQHLSTEEPNLEEIIEAIEITANATLAKKKQSKKMNKQYKPIWWDNECEDIVGQKRTAMYLLKNQFTLENFLNYKKITAKIRKQLKEKKMAAFKVYCEQIDRKTPPQKIWKTIRSFKNYYGPTTIYNDMPENLKKQLLDNLTQPIIPLDNSEDDNQNRNQHTDVPIINLNELNILTKNKRDTAPGMDGITYSMIKNLSNTTKKHLVRIFNNYLNGATIPASLKDQLIITFLKPGKNPKEVSSYRPISLQSCVGKILSTMVKNRLELYIEKNSLLDNLALGFRRGKSTMDAVLFLTNNIYNGFASNLKTVVVFMDLTAAYDHVNVEILTNILNNLDIPDKLIQLTTQFLRNRRILMRSGYGNMIGPQTANNGLPQGSTLSPLLFNLYTKSLREEIGENIKLIQYADDMTLICTGPDMEEIIDQMNETMDRIMRWIDQHQLKISLQKTKYMVFSKGQLKKNFSRIKIGDTPLVRVGTHKYLGVILDENMRWKEHTHHTINKAQQGLNIIRSLCKIEWGAHPCCLLLVYKALIRSQLEYGRICILKCSKKLTKLIDKYHLQALRVVIGVMRSTPISNILSECAEMNMRHRQIILATKQVGKWCGYQQNEIKENLFQLYHVYNTSNYWRKRRLNTPPLIEAIKIVIQDIDIIRTSDKAPIFQEKWEVLYSPVEYVDSGLPKQNNISNNGPLLDLLETKFSGYKTIYTDGSVDPTNSYVGVAVYCGNPNYRYSLKLDKRFNIVVAELWAIRLAIKFIREINHEEIGKKFAILTDSKSAVSRICRDGCHKEQDTISLQIRMWIMQCKEEGLEIKLIWIPSHTGIIGNDKADELAKKGVIRINAEEKIDYQELLSRWKNLVWIKWNETWKNMTENKGKRYALVVKKPYSTPWYKEDKQLTRIEIVTFCRMRTQHCHTPQHLQRIGILDSDRCQCGEVGNLQHILLECRNNNHNINVLYNKLRKIKLGPVTISDIITNPTNKIIKIVCSFFKHSNIKL